MKFIVTAGGQGTKLWPLSRNSIPKQFQPITGTTSTFAQNIEVLLTKYAPSDIFISTKRKYVKHVLEQAPQISFNNLIIEPDYEKSRGPGEGYAFLKLSLIAPDEILMLIQSDVVRLPQENFLTYVEEIEKVVKTEKKFVTGGKKAIKPEMGADYLKLGKLVKTQNNVDFYECGSFVPRLNEYKATEQLINDFHVVLHVNHFACYPHMILDAYKKFRPDWHEALMKIRDVIGDENEESKTNEIYETMEAGSTEEVTVNLLNKENFIIALTNFAWTDFGTWGSVQDFAQSLGTKRKKTIVLDSEGSFGKARDGKLIVIYGVDDVVVIDTDDALLVIHKEKTGKVGEVLKEIKKKGLDSFL